MRLLLVFGLTGLAGFSQYFADSTGDLGPLPLNEFDKLRLFITATGSTSKPVSQPHTVNQLGWAFVLTPKDIKLCYTLA